MNETLKQENAKLKAENEKLKEGHISLLKRWQDKHQALLDKVTVEGVDKVIKDYFGYKDVSTPVYNMRFGCELSEAIVKYLLEE